MNKITMLIAVAALSLTACVTAPTTQPSGLTFLHLNDTYRVGAVEDGAAGGFSRVVTLARALQAQGRDVRILHGGDFLYPSLESQLWDGLQMVDAMNFLNSVAPLYTTSGNHEFDRRARVRPPWTRATRGGVARIRIYLAGRQLHIGYG
jgi:5'-nucleotidase